MDCSTSGLPDFCFCSKAKVAGYKINTEKSLRFIELEFIKLGFILTKVRLVKAMVFPVVMYGCESWTVKKAEHQRIDAFEPWCWRRLSKIPWTVTKEIQPVHSKGDQSCVFIGRTDAEAETPILWPLHAKS